MYELKSETIRSKYFKQGDGFDDLTPDKAEKKRRQLVAGLDKLRKLSKQDPLRDDVIELFKKTIATMNAIKRGQETTEMFEDVGQVFEDYVNKVEGLIGRGEGN